MVKVIDRLDFLCKSTVIQYCCTSSHEFSDFVLIAVCGCEKSDEVTVLCWGWTALVVAFERGRSWVERSVILALSFIFNSFFCICEFLQHVLNSNPVLYGQFTKETPHKVIKS